MTPLETAIEMGRAAGKKALYFGCWQRPGHYLHRVGGATVYDPRETLPGFPWTMGLLDGGLLKNGGRSDVYDGRVFWTCGGSSFWYAFFWWDNSVDRRRGSNAGLYVRGFGWPEAQAAFDYACGQFPGIVARQRQPLVLQAARRRDRRQGLQSV